MSIMKLILESLSPAKKLKFPVTSNSTRHMMVKNRTPAPSNMKNRSPMSRQLNWHMIMKKRASMIDEFNNSTTPTLASIRFPNLIRENLLNDGEICFKIIEFFSQITIHSFYYQLKAHEIKVDANVFSSWEEYQIFQPHTLNLLLISTDFGSPNVYRLQRFIWSIPDGSPRTVPIMHSYVLKSGFLVVKDCLITSYSHSHNGYPEEAMKLFDDIGPYKSVFSWNALLDIYVANSSPSECLWALKHMVNSGLRPNPITIKNILDAGIQAGCIKQAMSFYFKFEETYGVYYMYDSRILEKFVELICRDKKFDKIESVVALAVKDGVQVNKDRIYRLAATQALLVGKIEYGLTTLRKVTKWTRIDFKIQSQLYREGGMYQEAKAAYDMYGRKEGKKEADKLHYITHSAGSIPY